MKANNMSDEELDNLFKAAANNIDPAYDPQAWEAMHRKLQQDRYAWLKHYFPSLLVVLMLGLLITSDFSKHSKQPHTASTSPAMMSTTKEPAAKPKDNKSAVAPKKLGTIGTAPAVSATAGKELATQTNLAPKVKKATLQQSKSREESSAVASDLTSPTVQGKFLGQQAIASAMARTDTISNQRQSADHGSAPSYPAEDGVKAPLVISEKILTDSLANPDPTQEVQEAANNGIPHKQSANAFLNYIQLSLLVGPDLSTVESKDWSAISTNGGIGLTIPLSKRISLFTGAVWANKLYNAAPEDYAPGTGYWYGKNKPNAISARCRVIDIPLDIRYQLLKKGRNALALQAGISSYLMQDERYTYIYPNSGYGNYNYTWEVESPKQYWFSIQNLSVSYTREVSPAFSIGAQPFAKIPLAGVGAGKVKLMSVGILFSASYTINFRRP